jgi:ribosomal protein S18 acetylase RimI-like enzyme
VEEISWIIRSFKPQDLQACRGLYFQGGLLDGGLASNDTGADVDNIEAVYMHAPGNHFWVAQLELGNIVGMVGVQHYPEESEGQIRRLRVAKEYRRRGIGSALVEAALKFCQENQYLKVTLDTSMEREAAVRMFKKFRFRHETTRQVGNKELLYFYFDLYGGTPRAAKGEDLHHHQRPAYPA